MKKGEFISGPEFSYEYFREFAGIKFRFVSDDLFLKEIDFYKGKKFNETCSPPPSAPLSMIVKYFEAYFSGTGAERFSILFRHNFKDKKHYNRHNYKVHKRYFIKIFIQKSRF